LNLKLDGQNLINELFYVGEGNLDVPNNQIWKNSLDSYLPQLIQQGLYYSISGNTLYIYNSGCDSYLNNKNLTINIGIDFSISCN